MKTTFWILYMIACPNCEWKDVYMHKTLKECVMDQRDRERSRSAIGYWNDPVRFECKKEIWKKLSSKN